jgi:hypothetical protein
VQAVPPARVLAARRGQEQAPAARVLLVRVLVARVRVPAAPALGADRRQASTRSGAGARNGASPVA